MEKDCTEMAAKVELNQEATEEARIWAKEILRSAPLRKKIRTCRSSYRFLSGKEKPHIASKRKVYED